MAGTLRRSTLLDMAAAGNWGLLRNAFQEFPAIKWSGRDIAGTASGAVSSPAHCDSFGLAMDGGAWHTPRMVPSTQPARPPHPRQWRKAPASHVRPAGIMTGQAWMITGGLGGLGLLFAEWAGLQGASNVSLLDVIAGSLPATIIHLQSQQQQQQQQQQQRHSGAANLGCAFTTFLADSGSADAMAATKAACTSNQNVDGVMHAAGVLRDATIANQTPASFRAVLGCKVTGLHTMHQALQGLPVANMVLFSSVSSIVAPLGQPNYAAANAMLNHWSTAHSNQVSATIIAVPACTNYYSTASGCAMSRAHACSHRFFPQRSWTAEAA